MFYVRRYIIIMIISIPFRLPQMVLRHLCRECTHKSRIIIIHATLNSLVATVPHFGIGPENVLSAHWNANDTHLHLRRVHIAAQVHN